MFTRPYTKGPRGAGYDEPRSGLASVPVGCSPTFEGSKHRFDPLLLSAIWRPCRWGAARSAEEHGSSASGSRIDRDAKRVGTPTRDRHRHLAAAGFGGMRLNQDSGEHDDQAMSLGLVVPGSANDASRLKRVSRRRLLPVHGGTSRLLW